MLSVTVSVSNSAKCWCTIATPSRRAVFGLSTTTAPPSISIVPASGCTSPAITFIRVDLPAPFSPRIAWISPGATSSETASLATTAG